MTPSRPAVSQALAACLMLLAAVTPGCSSAPDPDQKGIGERSQVDPLPRMTVDKMLDVADKALADYSQVINGPNTMRNVNAMGTVDRFMRQLEEDYRSELFSVARDMGKPVKQATAVAALGFSNAPDALPTILSALSSSDEPVVANAVFGLAILKHPDTPPGALAGIIDDESQRIEVRACAAWALYEIQAVSLKKQDILGIWTRMLQQPAETYDPTVLLSAVRGVGAGRDPQHARLIHPYLSHPTPKIREAACIAIERMGDQASWELLVKRLESSETNPNVRLAAQKALQALAGVADEQYDAKAWRRVFERGIQVPK